ncbi:MAG: hemerythrin family protein, partial [Alphaproteobacteria bacterium]|nr:hemerythrin family protein [Alphaproteobacteria bacterium]
MYGEGLGGSHEGYATPIRGSIRHPVRGGRVAMSAPDAVTTAGIGALPLTGDSAIDGDHQALVEIVDLLGQAEGRSGVVVQSVLATISEALQGHFAREEKMMGSSGFPYGTEHKRKHQKFGEWLDDKVARHARGEEWTANTVHQGLVSWLTKHVAEEDVRYRPWLANAQIDRRRMAFVAPQMWRERHKVEQAMSAAGRWHCLLVGRDPVLEGLIEWSLRWHDVGRITTVASQDEAETLFEENP